MVYGTRIALLDLVEEPTGVYRWTERKRLWASVEQTGKSNLFSRVGIGARGVSIGLHPTAISLDQAVRWNGRHCFLTSVIRDGPVSMEAQAALVDVVECTARQIPEDDSGDYLAPRPVPEEEIPRISFPAVLTEKYLGFSQEAPMARVEQTYVLVTPKPVELEEGDLVTVEAHGVFAVRVRHLLDPHKNEYEMHKRSDA